MLSFLKGEPFLTGTLLPGIYYIQRCNYDILMASSTLQQSQLAKGIKRGGDLGGENLEEGEEG